MDRDEIEARLLALEAKQQVMAALMHALAQHAAARQTVAESFRERADALQHLLSLKGEPAFAEAFSLARLAVERALDDTPATH